MAFVSRVVGADERLIGVCNLHWIYLVRGFLYFLAFAGAGLVIRRQTPVLLAGWDGTLAVPLLTLVDWVSQGLAGVGVLLVVLHVLKVFSTEIGLTDKRVIFKRGIVFVEVKEEDLEEIKGAEVDNGWLGRFLNYGYIFLDARFIKNVNLPAIPSPYAFVRALNEAKSRLKPDTLKVVLDERGVSKAVLTDHVEPSASPPAGRRAKREGGPRTFERFRRLRRGLMRHFSSVRAGG